MSAPPARQWVPGQPGRSTFGRPGSLRLVLARPSSGSCRAGGAASQIAGRDSVPELPGSPGLTSSAEGGSRVANSPRPSWWPPRQGAGDRKGDAPAAADAAAARPQCPTWWLRSLVSAGEVAVGTGWSCNEARSAQRSAGGWGLAPRGAALRAEVDQVGPPAGRPGPGRQLAPSLGAPFQLERRTTVVVVEGSSTPGPKNGNGGRRS